MKTLEEYLGDYVTEGAGEVAIHEIIDDKYELFHILAKELEDEFELHESMRRAGYEITLFENTIEAQVLRSLSPAALSLIDEQIAKDKKS